MTTLTRWLLSAGAIALAAGCSTPMDARRDTSFQSYAHASDRPVSRPVRSMSSFSDSLQCMDRLLRDAQIPTTLITSKQIPDFSARVPVATKDMIVTGLLQMSRTSNVFRYVDYEVDIARQDTVQNLTNILLNNNQIQLQRPSLYISGAVSFVDQNVLNNRMQAGTSATRFETGYSQNRNATLIGLELHFGDFRTRTMIPGMDSANEVIIGNGGQGLDLAGRIGEYGWQFNVGRDYAQGSGAAIRTLVDLALIELTGKWARIPYWQCLTMEQTHPSFQRQLRDWYDEGTPGIHRTLVHQSLLAKGYIPQNLPVEALDDTSFRKAVARFQADNGMVVTGQLDFMVYERALRDYVALDDMGRLSRVGWTSRPPTRSEPAYVTPDFGMAQASARARPRSLDIQIENVLLGRTEFELGEQVFLSVTLAQTGFLSCYLSNASGGIIRLIPNVLSSQSQVAGQFAVRLPDWMSPNPGYVIETAGVGTEGVLCLATPEVMADKLPEPLKSPAFARLQGVKGFDDIVKAYQEAAGEMPLAHGRVSWQVGPRRMNGNTPAVNPSPSDKAQPGGAGGK
jgi:hypothetical protein